MNKVTLWTVIIVGLILLVFGLAKLGTSPSTSGSSLPLAVDQQDNFKGAENAKVTIVEYSDFQCPSCGRMYPILKQLVETFPNDVKVVYRHFPLRQIHNNAGSAAQASEAAALQGKFWDMHDILFNTQNSWSNAPEPEALFEKYAESIGLDLEKFESDFSGKQVKYKVGRDERSAAGLNGTPTLYLNGTQIEIPGTYEEFKKLVEEKISS